MDPLGSGSRRSANGVSPRGGRIRRPGATGPRKSRPDSRVRWSRVLTARARVAAGFYDRGEVRARLIESLLGELNDA
jgi:hypothetical protein